MTSQSKATMDIQSVQKGDIVRFASYALRVEVEPIRTLNTITLQGRISINGCPIVVKKFIGPREVKVERA
jgi:hypothetical protein